MALPQNVEVENTQICFSPLKRDTVNQSRWNLAWKSTPWVHRRRPYLAVIDKERVDIGALEFDSFAPWRGDTITKENWHGKLHHGSKFSWNFALIGKVGKYRRPKNLKYVQICGISVYTNQAEIWHGRVYRHFTVTWHIWPWSVKVWELEPQSFRIWSKSWIFNSFFHTFVMLCRVSLPLVKDEWVWLFCLFCSD